MKIHTRNLFKTPFQILSAVAATAAISLLGIPTAQAQTPVYFQGTPDPITLLPDGTSGVWTDAVWNDAVDGTGSVVTPLWADTTTNSAVFNTTPTNGAGVAVVTINNGTSTAGITVTNSSLVRVRTNTGNSTLNVGSGGITLDATAVGGLQFSQNGGPGNQVNIVLDGSQTWTNNSSAALQILTVGSTDLGTGNLSLEGTGTGGYQMSTIVGAGSVTINTAGTVSYGGAASYSGDTIVSSGTFNVANGGSLAFKIAGNGINNQISGPGTVTLDGSFAFDLTGASTTLGDSWSIVDAGTFATTTFGATFTATSTLGSFVDDGSGNFYIAENGTNYLFSTGNGILSVSAVPEPSTIALIGLGLAGFVFFRRRAARA